MTDIRRRKMSKGRRLAHVEPESFYVVRRTAGLSRKEAAAYLGVSLRTIRNWENGTYRIPYPAFKLVRMRAGGIVQAPGWDGWSFGRGGALYSPCGRSFTASDLYNIRHVFSMVHHLTERHRVSRAAVEVMP